MRMKKVKVNIDEILHIYKMELTTSRVIILSQDKAKVADLPAFAETKIVTHQGEVKCVKWDEGEEF